MTNAQGDSTDWFRTYRPVVGEDDGWYWLGPSLDDRWALIVRENIPDSGALCEITRCSKIHTNTGASKAKDDESFWRLHPSRTNYVALGHFFESGVTTNGSFAPPNFQSEELKTLRGVRLDLCEKATLNGNPKWTNAGETGTNWVSVYELGPLQNKAVVQNQYHFLAFDNDGAGVNLGKNRDTAIYMLKSDSIYVEPWE